MIRGLAFVELTVADWPAAVAWYRDVLGLPLRMQDAAGRFALFDAGTGRIALKEGQPEPGSVLLSFEVDDLVGELRRLAEHGVGLESAEKVSSEGYRRAILHDLDGYRICLFEWLGGE
ncbi:hypothetical protein AYO44_01255 [Planctomycetaceae bacterium SCGC AG-212-F19]|nr:hypothetical protein AYO44_01255 [Planctomycetaceae bacterium SCGC AG-212-F19]